VIGSTVVHLALVIGLFLYGRTTPRYVVGPDAMQVSVVDIGSLPRATQPAPREPEPARDAAKLEPTDDVGVKVEPPRPDKKRPPEEPKEKLPPPRPALSFESVGNSGLKAAVGLDDADFEFTYYLMLIRNRVAENWTPPNGIPAGGQPIRATVLFRIARDGSLSGIRLESASGAEYFDRSVMRAIVLSNPMPGLPDGWSGNSLGVHFGFEYEAP
jgi:protein TonB